jgi:hypothetical protein
MPLAPALPGYSGSWPGTSTADRGKPASTLCAPVRRCWSPTAWRQPARQGPACSYEAGGRNAPPPLEPRPRIELGTSCLPSRRIFRLSYRGMMR